jgi:hypothetical protein
MSRFAELNLAVESHTTKLKEAAGSLQGASKEHARKINADALKFEMDANRQVRE